MSPGAVFEGLREECPRAIDLTAAFEEIDKLDGKFPANAIVERKVRIGESAGEHGLRGVVVAGDPAGVQEAAQDVGIAVIALQSRR